MRALILIILLLKSLLLYSSGAGELDSLYNAYKAGVNDSIKSRRCLDIGDYYEDIDIDKSIDWGKRAVVHAKTFGDMEYVVKAINWAASYYHLAGDPHQQIREYMEAYKIAEQNGYFDMQGSIANNIGASYISIGDSTQSLIWLERSIELKEKYSPIGKLAKSYSNFGSHYFDLGLYEESIEFFNKAWEIEKVEKNYTSIATILGNLVDCYLMLEQFDNAEKLNFEALKIERQINDQYSMAKWYINTAWLYNSKGESNTALIYSDTALQINTALTYDRLLQQTHSLRSEIFENLGQYENAYQSMKESFILWKELNAQEANENLNELRTKYETEKVQNENLLLRKDSEIDAAMISNQRLIIWASIGGLMILIILIYFLNKWNKDKRKQNVLLAEQKGLVETKNREILDSIQYAKRIQAAILPPRKMMDELFDDYFVFYRPKDVVAGDFYWVEKYKNTVLFAAADCTGHGVPGALVSVFCHNGLNRSVREEGLIEPGKILDNTRKILLKEFEKSEEDVKDGMDIALCSYDGQSLKYAGANNHLWLIRKGTCIEYRADKQPIGKTESGTPFNTYDIDVEEGDTIYMFSDGYADQFGGEKGKKMKSAVFKKFLTGIADRSMKEQESEIERFFLDWMRDEEQVDDVCVFAVRF